MSNKKNYMLAGISAAAVAVLSVGGYFLHRKVLKYRLRELARRQAMNLAMSDMNGDIDDCDDYYNEMFQDLDNE